MARGSRVDRLKLQAQPEKGLKLTFIALTFVILLSGAINLRLTRTISRSHANQIKFLQLVAEQRVLIQNVHNYSRGIVKAKTVSDTITNQVRLGKSLIALELSNMKLLSPNADHADSSGSAFLLAYAKTKDKFNAFDAKEQALVSEIDPVARIKDEREATKAEDSFDSEVDNAMLKYGVQIRQQENREQALSTEILAANVVFLLGFGLVFFYPSIKRVTAMVALMRQLQLETDAFHVELQARQAQLEASQDSLESTNRMLLAQKEALVESSEQLQSMTEASQAAARRFEELFQAMPVACVGFDQEGTIYDWNREAVKSFGYEAYEVLHRSIWEYFFGEELLFATKLIRLVFGGKAYHNIEVKMNHRSGESRWFLLSIFPIRDAKSHIVGAISACIDVTESKSRQDEIARNAKTFESVIASLEECLMMVDSDSRVLIANSNACRYMNMDSNDLIGFPIKDLPVQTCDENGTHLLPEEWPAMRTLRTGKPLLNQVLGVCHEGYTPQWLNLNTVPVAGHGEEGIAGAVISFTDITAKKQKEQALMEAYSRLEALASTDGLTGLYNHRTFHEKLDEALQAHQDGSISLILMDVDQFKQYNDSFGHPAGDYVLKSVAQVIQSACPDDAIAARYGGEEFAVILPGYNMTDAGRVAEAIRVAVESNSWPLREVTLSLGVISKLTKDAQHAELISGADKALYASKRAGRNRVTLDGHIPDLPDRRHVA